MVKAVFFDLDGTLADSFPFLYRCYADHLKELHDRTAPFEELLQIAESSYEEGMELVRNKHGIEDPALFYNTYFQKVILHYPKEVTLFPGARELLESLSERVDLYLTTSAEEAIASSFLQDKELEHLFADLITPKERAKIKPHPHIYEEALARSGVASHQALVVEDSRVGVQAAQAAGLQVVVVQQGPLSVEADEVKKHKNLFALKEWFDTELA